jgi:hypothetical protein
MTMSLLLALAAAAPIAASAPVPAVKPGAERVQIGFYRFRGTRVRVSFEKRILIDKVIAAPPRGDRSGISDFTWVQVSGCGTLTVTTGRTITSQRLCPRDGTKSVKINAGPPLTLTMLPTFQGDD